MTTLRERWILLGTLLTSIFFSCFFIWPNYSCAKHSAEETKVLVTKVEQIQRRQSEVELLRKELQVMERQVELECKGVPKIPEMASIVKVISLEIADHYVEEEAFVVGNTIEKKESDEGFDVQPLSVSMKAEFDLIMSIMQRVEAMDRLVRISSVHITRSKVDVDIAEPLLDVAIGLHAMYDSVMVP